MKPSRVPLAMLVVVGMELLANFVLPYIIYVDTAPRLGDVHALLASSLPPIVWSLIEFARSRRVDALSLIVLAGIVLSLLAFIGGGSVRLLQLRENVVTGLIALVFLGSAAIGRPLIYYLARAGMLRRSPEQAETLATRRDEPRVRHTLMMLTLLWGFGLLAQTILACVLVFAMPIAEYLIVSPFVGYGAMGCLGLWTFLYVRHRQDWHKRVSGSLNRQGAFDAGPTQP